MSGPEARQGDLRSHSKYKRGVTAMIQIDPDVMPLFRTPKRE
jgi:hypothetical protein